MKIWQKTAAGLLFGALVAFGGVSQAQDKPSEVKIAFPVDVPSWDPTAFTAPPVQSIFKAVFDSPMFVNDKLETVPRLIKSYRWLDEGKTLELEFRDDVYFHDGSKLTAEDFKFTFDRAIQTKTLSLSGMMATLESVEVIEPYKAIAKFKVASPTVPKFLGFLASYILPKDYFEKVGEAGFQKQPIGAGPYKIVDYQRGSRITLEAFDKYWQGEPEIKRVIFEIVTDSSARVAAVESGRVDVSVQIPVREVARLQKNPKLEAKVYPYSEIYILQIPSYVDTFQNVHLRRAMQLAIDKQGLSRAFYNNVAKPISLLASKGSPGDVADFETPFDREKAIEELAKAGYSKEKPLKIRLFSSNNTFPSDYDMARAIAQMWSQIGIETTVEEITVAKYLELSHSSKLDGVMLYSWANATGDPEIFTGSILDPRLRFSTWKQPELAEVFDQLKTQVDDQKRLEGYRELNVKAAENAWSIPVLQSVSTVAHNKDLNVPTYQTGYILPQEYSWK